MNKVLTWAFEDPEPEDDRLATELDYEPPTVYGFGHQEMYRRVGRVLRHDDKVEVPSGHEGRKSVAILSALYRSNETGNVITFPLNAPKAK